LRFTCPAHYAVFSIYWNGFAIFQFVNTHRASINASFTASTFRIDYDFYQFFSSQVFKIIWFKNFSTVLPERKDNKNSFQTLSYAHQSQHQKAQNQTLSLIGKTDALMDIDHALTWKSTVFDGNNVLIHAKSNEYRCQN
jgi:hypothetical protein